MKITENNNGTIQISTPYNPEFVGKIKNAGARWNSSGKTWDMDVANIDTARAIMREVYGTDDTSPASDCVSVRITVNNDIYAGRTSVTMLGKTIATASGRDSGARLGDGVCFEAGGADSGGSAKNWGTVVKEGSVIVLHGVPKAFVETGKDLPADCTVELIQGTVSKKDLEDEKARLLSRIAEIDRLIAQ